MKMPSGATDKAWGWCIEVYRSQETRLVRAHAESGGSSSLHLHRNQHNIFVVISGMLLVLVDHGNCCVEHRLAGNEMLMVKAGVKHKFIALSDVDMFEQYLAVDGIVPQESDIVRFSEAMEHQ